MFCDTGHGTVCSQTCVGTTSAVKRLASPTRNNSVGPGQLPRQLPADDGADGRGNFSANSQSNSPGGRPRSAARGPGKQHRQRAAGERRAGSLAVELEHLVRDASEFNPDAGTELLGAIENLRNTPKRNRASLAMQLENLAAQTSQLSPRAAANIQRTITQIRTADE